MSIQTSLQPNTGFIYQPPSNIGMIQIIHMNELSRPIQYKKKAARGLGITQMIIGIICLISNIIILVNTSGRKFPSLIGYGIWCGILFVIAGSLEVLSAKDGQAKCSIIAAMVMSIIAACFSSIVFSLAIIEAILTYLPYPSYDNPPGLHLAFAIIMILMALVEAVIAIIGSALCCAAVCCSPSVVPYLVAGNEQAMNRLQSSNYQVLVGPKGQGHLLVGPAGNGQFPDQLLNPPSQRHPNSDPTFYSAQYESVL